MPKNSLFDVENNLRIQRIYKLLNIIEWDPDDCTWSSVWLDAKNEIKFSPIFFSAFCFFRSSDFIVNSLISKKCVRVCWRLVITCFPIFPNYHISAVFAFNCCLFFTTHEFYSLLYKQINFDLVQVQRIYVEVVINSLDDGLETLKE